MPSLQANRLHTLSCVMSRGTFSVQLDCHQMTRKAPYEHHRVSLPVNLQHLCVPAMKSANFSAILISVQ